MKRYLIAIENSPKLFKDTCQVIESSFLDRIKKEKLLIDVDGSTIQTYIIDGHEITVYDDYDYCDDCVDKGRGIVSRFDDITSNGSISYRVNFYEELV